MNSEKNIETGKEKIPDELESYLTQMRIMIKTSYEIPKRGTNPPCIQIAEDVATIFLEHGMLPSIVHITGKRVAEDKSGRELLRPLKYDGRVAWRNHAVCVYKEMAYDPLLEAPILLSEYANAVFGTEVETSVSESEESMKSFLMKN